MSRDPHTMIEDLLGILDRGIAAADSLLVGDPIENRGAFGQAANRLAHWHGPPQLEDLMPQIRGAAGEFSVLRTAAGMRRAGEMPGHQVATHIRTTRRALGDLRREVAHRKFRAHAEPILLEAMPNLAASREVQRQLARAAMNNPQPPAAAEPEN